MMHFPMATGSGWVLAQDGPDWTGWAIILFVVISSIISGIGNMIRKKRGESGKADLEEDEGPVIILTDEFGRPPTPPPVARRARPPMPAEAAERQASARRPVRPAPPRPPAKQRPTPPPAPSPARRREAVRPKPIPPRPAPAKSLADDHGAIEHAKHITKHADAIGDRAEEIGVLDDYFATKSIQPPPQAKPVPLDVSPGGLRRAIILNEILSPPLALRESDDPLGLR